MTLSVFTSGKTIGTEASEDVSGECCGRENVMGKSTSADAGAKFTISQWLSRAGAR